MKQKYFKTLPLFFLILALTTLLVIEPTQALTVNSTTGTWDTSTYPNYSDTDTIVTTGTQSLTYGTIGTWDTNGNGITIQQNVNSIQGNRVEWYWLDGVKRFVWVAEITDGTNSYYSWLYQAHQQAPFWTTSELKYGSQAQLWTPIATRDTAQLTNATYEIQAIRTNATTLTFTYALPIDTHGWYAVADVSRTVKTESFTVPSDFFTHELTYKLYVYHEGVGTIDVTFENPVFAETTIPNETGFDPADPEAGAFQQFIDFITNAATFLFTTAQQFTGILQALIPYLGTIMVIYLLDATISSIDQGSIQPIGKLFTFVWGIMQDAYARIADFAQAVAELIPF